MIMQNEPRRCEEGESADDADVRVKQGREEDIEGTTEHTGGRRRRHGTRRYSGKTRKQEE